MGKAKMKSEVQRSRASALHALANAICVRTQMDAKVVELFHQAAVTAESGRD